MAEREVSERFRELHSQVRRRTQGEVVVVRENFCPRCASSLAVDITLENHDLASASRPGVTDRYAVEAAV